MGRKSCSSCEAKDETITVLADQVDWLRAQLGTPWFRPEPGKLKSTPQTSSEVKFHGENPMDSLHMGEDEIDIREMQADGLLSTYEAEEALRRIGAANTSVSIS